ncbi:MAG: hypothetical protein ABEH38_01175 [Flavobacteriales bacterium]
MRRAFFNSLFCWLGLAFLSMPIDAQEASRIGQWLGRDKALGASDRTVAGRVGYGLSQVEYSTDQGTKSFYRHTLLVNLDLHFGKKFWLRTQHFFDLKPKAFSPQWISEMAYQIGHYDWRHKSFSFGYENYRPNKRSELGERIFQEMKEGYFFLSYKLMYQGPGQKGRGNLLWNETSSFEMSPFFRFYPKYPAPDRGAGGGSYKPVLGGNFRYTLHDPFYLDGALYFYPIQSQKLPWDPDYTYGFGLFDWRAFTVNLSYGNWIGNRFPWNKEGLPSHGFLNGRLELYLNYSW